MPHEPFTVDDLPLINRVLEQLPEVVEVLRFVKQVSSRAQYPIAGFDELAQALGGEDARLTIRGQEFRVGNLRQQLPAYYFPIGSEADLIVKVSDVGSRPGEPMPPPEGVVMGREIPLPEGVGRPPDIPDPPRPPSGGVGFRKDEGSQGSSS